MKVLFHVDDPARWPLALTNAQNLRDYCESRGEPGVIELVANGPAVQTLTREGAGSAGLDARMEALAAGGAVFAACRNAMRGLGIAPEALCAFVTPVPAGVAELAERQADGYAYIKP